MRLREVERETETREERREKKLEGFQKILNLKMQSLWL